jgi:excisionase family DNA binding protein
MCSESTAESEPSYLTVAQLAQRLQVSESTIYGWVDRDYISFLMAGDLVRFDPTAIHDWMLTQPIASVKRNEGFERYVVECRLLLAAATGREQPDHNPKTRRTLSLRFHDPADRDTEGHYRRRGRTQKHSKPRRRSRTKSMNASLAKPRRPDRSRSSWSARTYLGPRQQSVQL